MTFAPAVDPRLIRSLRRMPSLDSSAAVVRALRRRARLLGTTTPSYETVRRLVHAERDRRARVVASLATVLEVYRRRTQTTPQDVSWIFERNLGHARMQLRASPHTPKAGGKRRGPPFGGPRSR